MAKLNIQTSIVDYLKSQGEDSSYSARKKLASSMGISNYSGTASQNTQMLKALQSKANTKTNTKTTTKTNTTKAATKTATKTQSKAKTTNTTPKLNGVDDATLSTMTSNFTASNEQTKAQESANKQLSDFQSLASNKNIISDSTWDAINTQFVVPSAVTEADAYLKSQLSQIQSGKTSYTDQIKDMMSQIMNRDKFSYDVDADPLFQQALASAMNSGKTAMQDTIGQASALTGGYGSTYATSAGNQAYNAFIEDAYNNLPQYYQMAMEAYQAEGDEMYRQLGMLSDADATEYGRMVDAYNATSQYRNQMYNEAYSMYRDNKSDAFGKANLQLSENQQIVNNAFNSYQASADYANTLYEREYQSWADKVSQATNLAGMLNTDWWNATQYNEGVRQYEQNFAEEQRQYNESLAEEQRQYNQNYAQTEKWNQKEIDYKYAALWQDQNQFNTKLQSDAEKDAKKGSYSFTPSEIAYLKDIDNSAGGGEQGIDAVMIELEAMGKSPSTAEEADILYNLLRNPIKTETNTAAKGKIDWLNVDIKKSKDTANGFLGIKNIWGGIDSNDEYEINGKIYHAKDIKEAMEEDKIPQATIDAILKKINNLSENGIYNFGRK